MIKEFNLNGKKGRITLETEADLSVFEEIFVDKDYRILDKVISDSFTIMDLGAHVGCFSVYVALLNGSAKIFSFEPDVRNFSLMKENLKLNHVRSVVAKNVAVGGFDGDGELFVSEDSHNHSLMGEGESLKVSVRSFDGICKKFEKIDLVKMDIEGAEFEIFANISEVSLNRVGTFYIEYHEREGRSVDVIINRLKRAGFKVEKKVSFYDSNMGFLLATK